MNSNFSWECFWFAESAKASPCFAHIVCESNYAETPAGTDAEELIAYCGEKTFTYTMKGMSEKSFGSQDKAKEDGVLICSKCKALHQKIAFITYETPFSPCGGIAAVIGRLPDYMQKASGLSSIVITPFHHKIEDAKEPEKKIEAKATSIGKFTTSFDTQIIIVEILQYTDKHSWYFLKPNESMFFAGFPNPYLVGNTQERIAENLLRDSLFFGACVAKSLKIIDPKTNWTLMMQDWETATTALALADKKNHYKMFLTLHNSYDSKATNADLEKVGINPENCPPYENDVTVLTRALPLVQSTVFTVSEQFALDLAEDNLQSEVMAPHLQELLKNRLLGVNNGLFADLSLSKDILDKARQGDIDSLKKWKLKNRKDALKALKSFESTKEKPIWGDLEKFDSKDDSVCWFVMAGRDDTRQKGYDVAVKAIEGFLEKGGDARFFFFPIPGDEGLRGLKFLEQFAHDNSSKVIAFPFRWVEGYMATLQGSTFGIMPSLYEPFGMANEFYLNGTLGIGRATGGITQQIVPLWANSSFSYAAEKQAIKWHSEGEHATGILFRERDRIESANADWKGINAAKYDFQGGTPSRVKQRSQFALFEAMAYELSLAISDGVKIYQERPNLYYRMLVEGIDFIRNTFSWERSAQEYYRNIR